MKNQAVKIIIFIVSVTHSLSFNSMERSNDVQATTPSVESATQKSPKTPLLTDEAHYAAFGNQSKKNNNSNAVQPAPHVLPHAGKAHAGAFHAQAVKKAMTPLEEAKAALAEMTRPRAGENVQLIDLVTSLLGPNNNEEEKRKLDAKRRQECTYAYHKFVHENQHKPNFSQLLCKWLDENSDRRFQ